MRTPEEREQYERQQDKWLEDNSVQNGDLYVIITIPTDTDWPVGQGKRRLKAGDVVRVSDRDYAHDAYGVTIRKVCGRVNYGIPFWCLSKVESV